MTQQVPRACPRARTGRIRAGRLPVALLQRLPLGRLADVAGVVQREEDAVPAGGEPREREGRVEGPEGQPGELRGAGPGRAHAQRHRQAPAQLAQPRPRAPAAAPGRARGLRPRRRRALRGARPVPGALLPCGEKGRRLAGCAWAPRPAPRPRPAPQGCGGGSRNGLKQERFRWFSHPQNLDP